MNKKCPDYDCAIQPPPHGSRIEAYEAGSVFEVSADGSRERLWYPQLKCYVPFSADVFVVYTGDATEACKYASLLDARGYSHVAVVQESDR